MAEQENSCASIRYANQLSRNDMDNLQTRFAHTSLYTQDNMPLSHAPSMMITDSEQDPDSDDSDSADLDAEISYLESVVSQLSGPGNTVMHNPWHADIPKLMELYAIGHQGNMHGPGAMMASPCPIIPADVRHIQDMQFHGCSLYPSNTVAFAHAWPHPPPQSYPVQQDVPMSVDMESTPSFIGHHGMYGHPAAAMQSPYPTQQQHPYVPSYPPSVSPGVADDVVHLMGALQDYMTGLEKFIDLPSSS